MTDFTSALYLGMEHSSDELNGWQRLTTGVPAALWEPAISRQTASKVAAMQGLEKGLTAPSTLHLYWDLFGFLSGLSIRLYIDEQVYPVSRYGIEKLALPRIPVHAFQHQDAVHLAGLLRGHSRDGRVPVIISDGWCPVCGGAAPLLQYARLVKPLKGWVIVDDTQAFGLLGAGKNNRMPYGKGGGGLLPWLELKECNIITIVSLAKGFGVPFSVMSGPQVFIDAFAHHSETRNNSSPVSLAYLEAAMNAFRINGAEGDERRDRLWRHLQLLRSLLHKKGVVLRGGIFPVQAIHYSSRQQAIAVQEALKKEGFRTVLTVPHGEQHPVLTVIIRSDHSPESIRALAVSINRYHLTLKANDHVNTLTGNTYGTGSAKTAAGLFSGT